jgi:hypothetical protein
MLHAAAAARGYLRCWLHLAGLFWAALPCTGVIGRYDLTRDGYREIASWCADTDTIDVPAYFPPGSSNATQAAEAVEVIRFNAKVILSRCGYVCVVGYSPAGRPCARASTDQFNQSIQGRVHVHGPSVCKLC